MTDKEVDLKCFLKRLFQGNCNCTKVEIPEEKTACASVAEVYRQKLERTQNRREPNA